MINSIMDPIIWIGLLLPLAFLHGHFAGKRYGMALGAARMYDQMYKLGTPTSKKGVRTVELEDSESN